MQVFLFLQIPGFLSIFQNFLKKSKKFCSLGVSKVTTMYEGPLSPPFGERWEKFFVLWRFKMKRFGKKYGKKFVMFVGILFVSSLLFAGDLVSDGSNSWIFHTPDDGRTSLYIAPFTNGGWDWSKTSRFDNNGNVFFAGTVSAQSYACSSDSRYKTNIAPITGSLGKLLAMQGVSYSWNTGKFKEKGFDSRPQIGFIAQDVEKIFPELVLTDQEGFKSMSYDKMTAVIVEAMKEMKEKNDVAVKTLEKKIASLEQENKALKTKIAKIEGMNERIARLEREVRSSKISMK